jgi:hypothetical protein
VQYIEEILRESGGSAAKVHHTEADMTDIGLNWANVLHHRSTTAGIGVIPLHVLHVCI